jgi:hypothetical protein
MAVKMKKTFETIEQHEKAGESLYRAKMVLHELNRIHYGRGRNLRVARASEKALKALDNLRCVMDNAISAEFPGADDQKVCEAYFCSERLERMKKEK